MTDDLRKEFAESYKNNTNEKHFIKLFDKQGKQIIEPGYDEEDKYLDDLKLQINCFFQEALKLNTVSFLFGTGSSIPLGAVSISKIPEEIISAIKKEKLEETHRRFYDCYKDTVGLEKYLGDLIRLSAVFKIFKTSTKEEKSTPSGTNDDSAKSGQIDKLISTIKKSLFDLCKVPRTESIKDDYYENDPLRVHKEFIKKILARPVNLRRANLFTTNYDLTFESAMDELGVIYIDGFVGNTRRMFKPEVYNYDFYFPASTTEGNVHRLDKVVHLYKLHGSLNWLECDIDESNIYGIEQSLRSKDYSESLLIYPQPMKEEETLGFPYSEMFRRFSSIIQQPQNVLICYGYGFGDEHVNRVIYNALSISTFQLVIISYGWTDKLRDFFDKTKDDSRISFLIGPYLGDWRNWVTDLLPDIKKMDLEEKIKETVRKLKGKPPEREAEDGK